MLTQHLQHIFDDYFDEERMLIRIVKYHRLPPPKLEQSLKGLVVFESAIKEGSQITAFYYSLTERGMEVYYFWKL